MVPSSVKRNIPPPPGKSKTTAFGDFAGMNNVFVGGSSLLEMLKTDPFQNPPPYEKLVGDLQGAYSRRINIQHRLLYEFFRKEKTVRILRMWTHYE